MFPFDWIFCQSMHLLVLFPFLSWIWVQGSSNIILLLQIWTVQKIAWGNWQIWRWFGGVFPWLWKVRLHSQVSCSSRLLRLLPIQYFNAMHRDCSFQFVIILYLNVICSYVSSSFLFKWTTDYQLKRSYEGHMLC